MKDKTNNGKTRKLKPIAVFGIVFALGICAITIRTELRLRDIERDYVITQAYVYAVSPSTGRGYSRFYRFDVDGVRYYGRAFYGCEIGDVIEVKYSRKDPSKNRSINNGY